LRVQDERARGINDLHMHLCESACKIGGKAKRRRTGKTKKTKKEEFSGFMLKHGA
jgi:hypothetical protein